MLIRHMEDLLQNRVKTPSRLQIEKEEAFMKEIVIGDGQGLATIFERFS